MSSGLVGSSIQYGSYGRSASIHSIAGVDVPPLVGVDGDADAVADRLAGRAHAAYVVLQVRADLQLDLGEAVRDGLAGQAGQLLVGVAEPAGGGGVGGVAVLQQRAMRSARPGSARAQDLQRLLGGEGVGELAEVDLGDQVLGRHLAEEPPHRLARRAWRPGPRRR